MPFHWSHVFSSVQIRAKEAQKIEAEMTRNPEEMKRRAMLQRLPELTRILRKYPLMCHTMHMHTLISKVLLTLPWLGDTKGTLPVKISASKPLGTWWVHRRSQEFVLGGLRTEAPKALRLRHQRHRGVWGGGVPLLSWLGSLGEPHKLPQQGPVWNPGGKQILVYLELEKTYHFWHFCGIYLVTLLFTITKHYTFTYIFVPVTQLKRLCNFFHSLWGPRPPCPPLATPMGGWCKWMGYSPKYPVGMNSFGLSCEDA